MICLIYNMDLKVIKLNTSQKGPIDEFANDCINHCPHCNLGIRAEILYTHRVESDCTVYINALAKCPSCGQVFWAKYDYEPYLGSADYPQFFSQTVYYPKEYKCKPFDKEITEISPDFVTQYNEAEKAETLELNSICGIGYRRALEYLIRDFAIKLVPEKKDEIFADNSLSNIIRNYLPDTPYLHEVKEIALRAWWLGNDYAHYTQKHKDKGINDLKQCIDIAQNQVALYIRYDFQTKTIQNANKKNKTNSQ